MNLSDHLIDRYASSMMWRATTPVEGLRGGRRIVTEVPDEALENSIASASGVVGPFTGLNVITSVWLPVGEAAVLGLAGALVVGVRPLSRLDRLKAEARNDARAIVRRNLAEEIAWLGLTVRDEPTTPEEAVAFWTGRDEGTDL